MTLTISMTLTWDLQGNILKSCISGMGVLTDIDWKGCDSIGCWTNYVTLTFELTHGLNFGFSRSTFEIVALWNGWSDWCEIKRNKSVGFWVDYVTLNFDHTHDLELGFSKSIMKQLYLSNRRADRCGMKERKRCWTHYVTLTSDLTHDFDLGFLDFISVHEKHFWY